MHKGGFNSVPRTKSALFGILLGTVLGGEIIGHTIGLW